MNEKFSPELLEHKTHIVDSILEQIREMVCTCVDVRLCRHHVRERMGKEMA